MSPLAGNVYAALREIFDPCSVSAGAPLDIVAMGIVRDVEAGEDGGVAITLRPTSPMCTLIASIMEAVEKHAGAVLGVTQVTAKIEVAELWDDTMMSQEARRMLFERRERARSVLKSTEGARARSPNGSWKRNYAPSS